jgi:protein arginine N-methyltransferase 3
MVLLQDVYGFSMAPVAEQLRGAAVGKVHVREVPPGSILTESATLHTLHLDTMTPDQQDFTAQFSVQLTPAAAAAAGGSSGGATLAALVLWFDVDFSGKFCVDHPVTLSTSPSATPTHWVQAVMPLQPVVVLGGGDGAQALAGRLSMARSKGQHRVMDISLEYGAVAESGEAVGPRSTAVFNMEVTGE